MVWCGWLPKIVGNTLRFIFPSHPLYLKWFMNLIFAFIIIIKCSIEIVVFNFGCLDNKISIHKVSNQILIILLLIFCCCYWLKLNVMWRGGKQAIATAIDINNTHLLDLMIHGYIIIAKNTGKKRKKIIRATVCMHHQHALTKWIRECQQWLEWALLHLLLAVALSSSNPFSSPLYLHSISILYTVALVVSNSCVACYFGFMHFSTDVHIDLIFQIAFGCYTKNNASLANCSHGFWTCHGNKMCVSAVESTWLGFWGGSLYVPYKFRSWGIFRWLHGRKIDFAYSNFSFIKSFAIQIYTHAQHNIVYSNFQSNLRVACIGIVLVSLFLYP